MDKPNKLAKFGAKIFSADYTRDPQSFEIWFEFESAVPIRFDSKVMSRFENFWIGRAQCFLPSDTSEHTPP